MNHVGAHGLGDGVVGAELWDGRTGPRAVEGEAVEGTGDAITLHRTEGEARSPMGTDVHQGVRGSSAVTEEDQVAAKTLRRHWFLLELGA